MSNSNLSENQKNEAMERAKNMLKKMNIPLMPEAEKIMNAFLDGNISKSDALKQAKNVKKQDL